MPRQRWLLAIVPAVVAGAFWSGTLFGARQARMGNEWIDGQLLSTAIDSVRANALDSLPGDELIRRAVAGMVRELRDPYAALLYPDGYERYRGSLQGYGRGLGMSLRGHRGAVVVSSVAAGSPAWQGGVRSGDVIVSVDGVPTTSQWGHPVADSGAVAPDSNVLRVWRAPMSDTVPVVVRGVAWHRPAITKEGLLAPAVGYVRLSTISANASEEVIRAVDSLVERGATSLVFDLRGNGGGLLDEGVKVAGLFLPRGTVVTSLAGRAGAAGPIYRARNPQWTTLPMTVLVDEKTASAAEIIAAALQDYGRARIIGTPTYGKGLVQRVVHLSPELALRLTTARWMRPSGHSLERRAVVAGVVHGGMRPDVRLDSSAVADPARIPSHWKVSARTRVVAVADSVALHAIRDQWVTASPISLELRLRNAVSRVVPGAFRRSPAKTEWTDVATRLAVLRVLESHADPEALLRFSTREDPAVQAGMDLLTRVVVR